MEEEGVKPNMKTRSPRGGGGGIAEHEDKKRAIAGNQCILGTHGGEDIAGNEGKERAIAGNQSDGRECFNCHGATNVTLCQTVITCAQDETCYQRQTSGLNGLDIEMGCQAETMCSDTSSLNHGSAGIVGRSVNTRTSESCHECCSTDRCNSGLCSHRHPSDCIDDPTVDCARMNSLFNMCSTSAEHAAQVCPRFCRLCNYTNGNWAEWSSWSACSITCGNFSQSRTRTCTNPSPSPDGRPCLGESVQHQLCIFKPCPVDGGWSAWGAWGTCSATCGVGIKHRDRTCSNPTPSRFGNHCFGESRDDKICVLMSCTDGAWSTWRSWSTCSASCGGGVQRRHRYCNNPAPSVMGHNCAGTDEQTNICNSFNCYAKDGKIRLSGNSSASYYKGRVEIFLNNRWGTVCDDSFDNEDAMVVCHMLGFKRSGAVAKSSAYFGEGSSSLPIQLDDVSCSGTEQSIVDCTHSAIGTHNCGHGEDASVICQLRASALQGKTQLKPSISLIPIDTIEAERPPYRGRHNWNRASTLLRQSKVKPSIVLTAAEQTEAEHRPYCGRTN
ncbi:scavenger receptor cysteine-rich domain superfamily protein-like [Mya arenaria]|uniref:scavenger receptor cysteine-rich domain superfamily protein-like n=1 Tax=Mya arenaria TaxID=6604 RepID=UPI0022E5900D|nr:scavenger receptor cysteine-rich domain superfamily protein-like [Mya arenaria]